MVESAFPVVGTSLHDQADTFGADRSGGRSHKGIDIFAKKGTAVVAVRGGTVVKSGDQKGLGGLRVWIKDDEGFYHYYAHLNSIDVKNGQRIAAGQQLGSVGNTGLEAQNTPDHLHYSVNRQGHTSESGSVNPYKFLQSNGAVTGATDVHVDRSTDAQGRMRRVEAGLEDPGERALHRDPAQEFVESRRSSSDTMASIMSYISKAASQTGGRVLDSKALFGDVFADSEESTDGDETLVPSEVA